MGPPATDKAAVVLDTNVLVAAGFNPQSTSAGIVEEIRRGALNLVWHEATRRENQAILKQIPPLAWQRFVDLFGERARYQGTLDADSVAYVPDPGDRKFVALARATGAALITHDEDLLAHGGHGGVSILTPDEFTERKVG